MALQPGPKTPSLDVTISYSPAGTTARWTSDGAPKPAKIIFTTFETKGDEGRVVGTYQVVLCYAKSVASEPDLKNCRPIQGAF